MVTVVGYAVTSTGVQIPLRNDSVTNGTEFTLQTDSNVTTTAQDIGTYAPNQTLQAIEVFPVTINCVRICIESKTILGFGHLDEALRVRIDSVAYY